MGVPLQSQIGGMDLSGLSGVSSGFRSQGSVGSILQQSWAPGRAESLQASQLQLVPGPHFLKATCLPHPSCTLVSPA